jgi:RimJ/RimL family protein N-acetyltransferase
MVTLRKPIAGDVEARQKLGRHPNVMVGFGIRLDRYEDISRQEAQSWLDAIERNAHAWIIENDGKLIGLVRLDNVDFEDKRASMAIGIWDHTLLNQGYGQQAITACLKIAFKELGLHRISIRVLASNTRAIRCYEKCGFTHEGVEREAALVDGRFVDDKIMGILDRDFLC